MAQCEMLTRKKQPCPINAEAIDTTDGKWKCHVHHTAGVYRQQVEASRAERIAKRAAARAKRDAARLARERKRNPPPTAPLKDRH